jgi:hypothetical protein
MDTQIKVCTSCNLTLPETSFKLRWSKGRQSGTRQAQCNRCLYVKYTRPNVERKTKEIHDYQLKKGCADCGFNKHPAALEFDHVNSSEKLFNIGEEIGNRSRDVLWAEIAKCDVVCANCHAIRTSNRRELVGINE